MQAGRALRHILLLTPCLAAMWLFLPHTGVRAGSPRNTNTTLETSGDVVLVAAPASVMYRHWESGEELRLFAERTPILAAPLHLDISRPGTYDRSALTPDTLPTGTRVRSYLLHFDPPGPPTWDGPTVLSGAIVFPEPILGLISTRASLDASDQALGHPETLYPPAGDWRGNGREVEPHLADALVLSADRLTLTVHLEDLYLDHLRIVTGNGCGNRVVEAGEDCDDGNLRDGDCCSAGCRFEPSLAACDDGNACTRLARCDGAGSCVALDCDRGRLCQGGGCTGPRFCSDEASDGSCRCRSAAPAPLPSCNERLADWTQEDASHALGEALADLAARGLVVDPSDRSHWPLLMETAARELGCRLDPPPALAQPAAQTARSAGATCPGLATNPGDCMGSFDATHSYCGVGSEGEGNPFVFGAGSCINPACYCHDACGRERCTSLPCQFSGTACDVSFANACGTCAFQDVQSFLICGIASCLGDPGSCGWLGIPPPQLRCNGTNETSCATGAPCCGCNCAGDVVCGDCQGLEITGVAARSRALWGPALPGADPADVTVEWEGFAEFPLTGDFTVTRCPSGWVCYDAQRDFDSCVEPIAWEDAAGCWGGGPPPLPDWMELEFRLTDARGVTSPPRRAIVVCEDAG